MKGQPGKPNLKERLRRGFAFLQNTTLLQKGIIIAAAVVLVGGVTAAALLLPERAVETDLRTSSQPTSSAVTSSKPTSSTVTSSKPTSSTTTSSQPASSTTTSSQPASSAATSSQPVSSTAPSSQLVSSTPVPVAGLPSGYLPSFATAYSQNKDVVGRLTLSGTKLDYYVAKAADNVYYLNRTFTKAKSGWGNPYMDYRCTVSQNGNSHNMILYGHSNDRDGTQLSALKNYRDISFYRQHPTIKFDTVYGEGTYKVIAFFIENTKPGTTFFKYHMFINQTDPTYVAQFISDAKLRSYINTTVDWNASDQFLTISTCQDTNVSNYNRLVLVARKVRPGESTAVDTSGATQNAKQLLPKK